MIHQKPCKICGHIVLFDDKNISAVPLVTGCFSRFIFPLEADSSSSFFRAKDKNNSRALYNQGYTRNFISGLIGKSPKAVGNWILLDFDMFSSQRYMKEIDTLTLNKGESIIIHEYQLRNSRLFINDIDNWFKNFMITSAFRKIKVRWNGNSK